MRSTLAMAPSPPETSLARWLPARYFSLASLQRRVRRPVIPIATSTSALRRLVAARSLRRAASPIASRAGARDRYSVTMVSVTRMMAPTSAVRPIMTWKAKQIAR